MLDGTGKAPGDPLELVCQCGAACENKRALARHKKDCPVARLQRLSFGAATKLPPELGHSELSPAAAIGKPVVLGPVFRHEIFADGSRTFDEIKAEIRAKAEKQQEPGVASNAPSPEAQAAEGQEAVGSKAIPPGIAAHDAGQGKAALDLVVEPGLAPIPSNAAVSDPPSGLAPTVAAGGGKASPVPQGPGPAPTSPGSNRVASGLVDEQNAGGAHGTGAADATALPNAAGDGKAGLAPTTKGLGYGRTRCPKCGGVKSSVHPCKACGYEAHRAKDVVPRQKVGMGHMVCPNCGAVKGTHGVCKECGLPAEHPRAPGQATVPKPSLPSVKWARIEELRAALAAEEAAVKRPYQNKYAPAPCYEVEGGNSYKRAMDE
jgi:ribosomal protein L32